MYQKEGPEKKIYSTKSEILTTGETKMAQKKTILLIEDEEDIAALIKLQAEISGYKKSARLTGYSITMILPTSPMALMSLWCLMCREGSGILKILQKKFGILQACVSSP